jgi:hypothetical protein
MLSQTISVKRANAHGTNIKDSEELGAKKAQWGLRFFEIECQPMKPLFREAPFGKED